MDPSLLLPLLAPILCWVLQGCSPQATHESRTHSKIPSTAPDQEESIVTSATMRELARRLSQDQDKTAVRDEIRRLVPRLTETYFESTSHDESLSALLLLQASGDRRAKDVFMHAVSTPDRERVRVELGALGLTFAGIRDPDANTALLHAFFHLEVDVPPWEVLRRLSVSCEGPMLDVLRRCAEGDDTSAAAVTVSGVGLARIAPEKTAGLAVRCGLARSETSGSESQIVAAYGSLGTHTLLEAGKHAAEPWSTLFRGLTHDERLQYEFATLRLLGTLAPPESREFLLKQLRKRWDIRSRAVSALLRLPPDPSTRDATVDAIRHATTNRAHEVGIVLESVAVSHDPILVGPVFGATDRLSPDIQRLVRLWSMAAAIRLMTVKELPIVREAVMRWGLERHPDVASTFERSEWLLQRCSRSVECYESVLFDASEKDVFVRSKAATMVGVLGNRAAAMRLAGRLTRLDSRELVDGAVRAILALCPNGDVEIERVLLTNLEERQQRADRSLFDDWDVGLFPAYLLRTRQ